MNSPRGADGHGPAAGAARGRWIPSSLGHPVVSLPRLRVRSRFPRAALDLERIARRAEFQPFADVQPRRSRHAMSLRRDRWEDSIPRRLLSRAGREDGRHTGLGWLVAPARPNRHVQPLTPCILLVSPDTSHRHTGSKRERLMASYLKTQSLDGEALRIAIEKGCSFSDAWLMMAASGCVKPGGHNPVCVNQRRLFLVA